MSYAPKQTLEQGYEKFVIRNPEGCWGWKGCKANPGYGQFRHSMKIERAHRASWMIHFGNIPDGMSVLHKCDNRICSNPEHLFLGTLIDNNKDMLSKGYHPTIGKSGEKNPKAKLTYEKVQAIRQSPLKNIEISKLFNVHPMTISNIKRNLTWRIVQ